MCVGMVVDHRKRYEAETGHAQSQSLGEEGMVLNKTRLAHCEMAGSS